jgi:D-alanyl-D-alanine carboxypeptidase
MTRTACLPGRRLSVSVLTNAADGLCQQWLDGVVQILRRFDAGGAPSRRAAAWTGRWWTSWAAVDLLPMGDRVTVALPAQLDPFVDAALLSPGARRSGVASATIERDTGFGRHGEPARLEHDAAGRPSALWLGGTQFVSQAQASRELRRRAARSG